jgi:hypothetical protein
VRPVPGAWPQAGLGAGAVRAAAQRGGAGGPGQVPGAAMALSPAWDRRDSAAGATAIWYNVSGEGGAGEGAGRAASCKLARLGCL